MKLPSLDNVQAVLLLGAVGLVVYAVYKAAKELPDIATRTFNDVGVTVRNTVDNAETTTLDAIDNMLGRDSGTGEVISVNGRLLIAPDKISSSQAAGAEFNQGVQQPAWIDGIYQDWSHTPDDFSTASERMAKPDLGNLNQPNSPYPP